MHHMRITAGATFDTSPPGRWTAGEVLDSALGMIVMLQMPRLQSGHVQHRDDTLKHLQHLG